MVKWKEGRRKTEKAVAGRCGSGFGKDEIQDWRRAVGEAKAVVLWKKKRM